MRCEVKLEGYPQQMEVLKATEGEVAFIGGVGAGKALAIDTPILTPAGWTTMGDLAVGDVVYSSDGEQCVVTFTTPVMYGHRCYRVDFGDGSSIVSDAEHEWLTYDTNTRKSMGRALSPMRPCVVTTESIKNTLRHYDRECNHAIPIAKPLQNVDIPLPIHPYVLGVWLGDGDCASASTTITEDELLYNLHAVGCSTIKGKTYEGKAQRYCVGTTARNRDSSTGRMLPNDSLNSKLRELGQLNNKHIPPEYFRASFKQRISLLRGLMDTDGYVRPSGSFEFTNCTYRLAQDFLCLVRTLGIKARITVGDAKLNGRFISKKYRINFTTRLPIVTLGYKLRRCNGVTPKRSHYGWHYITSVEEVPSVPVKCIQVSSDNHLYLAGESLIPTHNTHVGAQCILDRLLIYPGANALVTAPSYRVLDMATLPKYELLFPPELIKRKKTRPYPEWELVTGGRIFFFSTDKPEGIVGGEVAFAHMDEASLSPYLAYTNVKKRMRQRDKNGKPYPYQLWITTTPKQLNWVYLEFGKPAEGKKLVQASTRDNIYRTRDEIDAYIEKLHLNEAELRQEIEGQFELLAGSCLFDKDSLDRQLLSCNDNVETRDNGVVIYRYPVVGVRYIAGADCAGDSEGDSSDLVILDAQTGEEVAELYSGSSMPADVFSRHAFNLLNEYNNPLFAPERNGTVGGIVITKMLELGYPNLYIDDKGKHGWYTTSNAIPPKVDRLRLLKEYEEAVRLRRTVVRSSDAIGEMSTFIMNKTGKYEGMDSCHDDRVMARAITWQMRKFKPHEKVGFVSVKRLSTCY